MVHYAIAGQAVYGDGIEYYAWLHSVYFDHDLNFKDELTHIYDYRYNNGFPNAHTNNTPALTPAGRVGNFHMPGMAILLMPFYALADIIVLCLNFLGAGMLRNGYSNIYQIVSGIGAVFYGILGIVLTEKTFAYVLSKNKFKNTNLVRAAVMLVVLASPLFYYLAIDVLNSQFGSFFAVSLFYYILFVIKENNSKYFWLGLVAGLAAYVRLQEAALLLPLLIKLAFDYYQKVKLKTLIIYFLIASFTFGVALIPLLLAWQYLYGSVLNHPYFIGVLRYPHYVLLGSLFDATNGLLTKTPLLLFLLLFFPFSFRKAPKEMFIFFAYFVVQIIGIETYGGWPAASFGGRMYISSLPLFFLLSAVLFTKLKKNWLILISVFFIVLNIFNILNFMLFQKQASGNSKGLEQTTRLKIERFLRQL